MGESRDVQTRSQVKTCVRKGCEMSGVLFSLVMNWVMRRTTEDQQKGIRWTLFDTLEDLDFTDDLALLSHTHQHMQEKTRRLSKFGQQVGLRTNKRKTEVITLNVNASAPVLLLMTRPFRAQRLLPIWAALSDRMEAIRRIFRAD